MGVYKGVWIGLGVGVSDRGCCCFWVGFGFGNMSGVGGGEIVVVVFCGIDFCRWIFMCCCCGLLWGVLLIVNVLLVFISCVLDSGISLYGVSKEFCCKMFIIEMVFVNLSLVLLVGISVVMVDVFLRIDGRFWFRLN